MTIQYIELVTDGKLSYELYRIGSKYVVERSEEYYNDRDSFDYRVSRFEFETEKDAKDFIERRTSKMYDYSMLRGRIAQMFKTQEAFSVAIGRTKSYVSCVLNGKSFLTTKDVSDWADALEIDSELIGAYFFCKLS